MGHGVQNDCCPYCCYFHLSFPSGRVPGQPRSGARPSRLLPGRSQCLICTGRSQRGSGVPRRPLCPQRAGKSARCTLSLCRVHFFSTLSSCVSSPHFLCILSNSSFRTPGTRKESLWDPKAGSVAVEARSFLYDPLLFPHLTLILQPAPGWLPRSAFCGHH